MPRVDETEGIARERSEDVEPRQPLVLDIVAEAGDWSEIGDVEALVAPVLQAVARHPRLMRHLPAEACLMLTDDAAMRRLNGNFRGKDKATNVLSFPSGAPHPGAGPALLGDIALGFETVMREAGDQAVAPADHVRHLVLHGMLHLMGFDHESDADASVMEALEIAILQGLGIANPYDEEAADTPSASTP